VATGFIVTPNSSRAEAIARGARRLTALALAVLVLGAVVASQAAARGGGDRREVRAAGVCGTGATSKLRLRQRDGGDIEVRFEVDHARSGQSWRVALVRERRVVWRGGARTQSGSFEIERRLPDFSGADQISARAVGPRGLTCTATATLPGN
jgi:hypothetical protein